MNKEMLSTIKQIGICLFLFLMILFLMADSVISTKSIANGTTPLQLQQPPLPKSYDYCVIKAQERNSDYWNLRKTRVIIFFNNEKYDEEFKSIEEALEIVGDLGYELRGSTCHASINNWYIYHTLYFIK